jgi:hypothetical protein
MGGIFETNRMLTHVESCHVCRSAPTFSDRCDAWSEMLENLMDWQCEEGPFEDGQDMCPICDGPVDDGVNDLCAQMDTQKKAR